MSLKVMLKIGMVLPIVWLRVLILSRKESKEIYPSYHRYARGLLTYLGFRLVAVNTENIPDKGPVFFVSNHQGTMDPVLIVGTCPLPMAFISKLENKKIPIFGRCSTSMGSIHFDRQSRSGNIYMLRESTRRLKAGDSLLIFPEGTRSKGDHMNEFKKGALQPAYLSKATIVPVTLNHAYCIEQRHHQHKELVVVYGEAIPYEKYGHIAPDEMSLTLHRIIKENRIIE